MTKWGYRQTKKIRCSLSTAFNSSLINVLSNQKHLGKRNIRIKAGFVGKLPFKVYLPIVSLGIDMKSSLKRRKRDFKERERVDGGWRSTG